MGIFSKFFKPKDSEPSAATRQATANQLVQPTQPIQLTQASQNSANFTRDDYGNIVVEYYDPVSTAREFYDTTKLVIDPNPIEVEGVRVYSAKVAWYGSNDAVMIVDGKCEPTGRANYFTDIKLEIDYERLYSDPLYQKVLMTELLDQKRVEYRYIPMGMEENPEQPCGDYVGGVSREYRKQFNRTVGQAIHNSPEMIEKRQKESEKKEEARQAQIASKEAQLKKLQEELDELNK